MSWFRFNLAILKFLCVSAGTTKGQAGGKTSLGSLDGPFDKRSGVTRHISFCPLHVLVGRKNHVVVKHIQ